MKKYLGKVLRLEVIQETELGYRLINEEGYEFFMHHNQSIGEIIDGFVNCFIYVDNNKRVTATSETPILEVEQAGFLKVKDIKKDLGVFVDNGIVKNHLLSKNDLPLNYKEWPIEEDYVFVKLKATNTNLVAKPVHYSEVSDEITPTVRLNDEEPVDAIVLNIGKVGINLITREGHSIFVHSSNYRGDYRIGQSVKVNIINMKNIREYNGNLIENKVDAIKSDSTIIFDYMKRNNGMMKYNNKSDADEIKDVFGLSKAAFKRGISNLYKDRKIDKNDKGWFIVDNN